MTWAHIAHLPAFNVVVGLASCGGPSATGAWQAGRAVASVAARGGAGPLPGGKGGSGPPRPVGEIGP
jgi:hypothetical protein